MVIATPTFRSPLIAMRDARYPRLGAKSDRLLAAPSVDHFWDAVFLCAAGLAHLLGEAIGRSFTHR